MSLGGRQESLPKYYKSYSELGRFESYIIAVLLYVQRNTQIQHLSCIKHNIMFIECMFMPYWVSAR